MKDPSTVEFLNEIYECISSPQSTSQATHLLKHYYNFFGTFELQSTLYRHKLANSSFLIHAIQQHNVMVVKFLLSLGVDVNFKHLSTCQTAIWALCSTHHTENTIVLLHLLLPHFNLELHSKDFATSLLYATLSISSEFSQYTVQVLDILLKTYHQFYIKTSPIPSSSTNKLDTSLSQPDNNVAPSTQPSAASYPQFNLPPKLLTGDVHLSYNSLPVSLQQYNNSQHESTSPPPNFQNNAISMSLFHLIFYNPSQIYFSFWCKQIIRLLLPYYWFFITQLPYETIYLNIFFFEQWILNSLLSSHLCTVESIMYIFSLDFYHLPSAIADEQPTTPNATQTVVSMHHLPHLEHPLLVNGKMPYFDYIYTFLEHLPMLHNYHPTISGGQHHGHVVYKGNYDTLTIIETLLALPSVNIHNWPWEEEDETTIKIIDSTTSTSTPFAPPTDPFIATYCTTNLSSNIIPTQQYPKITRYEFSQLIWVLFYTHPKPINVSIVNNIFVLIYNSTFHPSAYPTHPISLQPLISKQFKSTLQLNEHLYDPEYIYTYGSILSAFSYSNYPFSKDLFLFIISHITKMDPDYTKQVPFSYNALLHMIHLRDIEEITPDQDQNAQNTPFNTDTILQKHQLTRDTSLIQHYNTFYPIRSFFSHFLHYGLRVFSKYDENCIEFIKFIYHWFFYPFLYTATLSQNFTPHYPLLQQHTTPDLNIPTNNNSHLPYSFAELQLTEVVNDILGNTMISQYDSIQLIEYVFQLYTKDFPKVSHALFQLLFSNHIRLAAPNFHGLSIVYNLYTKYQTTGNNCPTYDKERIVKACASQFGSILWNIPQINSTQLLDNVFGFKKTKDATFGAVSVSSDSADNNQLFKSTLNTVKTTNTKTSSGNKHYDQILHFMDIFVKDLCKTIVNPKGATITEDNTIDDSTAYDKVGDASNTPYQEHSFTSGTLLPRNGSFLSFFSAENGHSNPFVFEPTTEIMLRSLFSEFLRYFKSKNSLPQRIFTFILFMYRTLAKRPVFSFHYQPNRPYREYLYTYDNDFFDSLLNSSSSTPTTTTSSFGLDIAQTGRRRGNVVTGPSPGLLASPSKIGGLSTGFGGDSKRFSLLPSAVQRSKQSVLPSQRPKLIKQPCWLHYYRFAQRFQQSATPHAIVNTDNLSNHKSPSKEKINSKFTSKSTTQLSPSPSSSSFDDSSSQSVGSTTVGLNIRFVNKPKQIASTPRSTSVQDSSSEDIPSPLPSPRSLQQYGDSSDETAPTPPQRKMLKPSNNQQKTEGPSIIRPVMGNIAALEPLLYPDDEVFIPRHYNNPSSITPTTPPLIPYHDSFELNHVYLHHYSQLRRNLFMSSIFDSNQLQQNTFSNNEYEKSRKSFVKSNNRRFELENTDLTDKHQLYSIDLFFSFIVHLISTNTYNQINGSVAMYNGKSPLLTSAPVAASNEMGGLGKSTSFYKNSSILSTPTLTSNSSNSNLDFPSPNLVPLPSQQVQSTNAAVIPPLALQSSTNSNQGKINALSTPKLISTSSSPNPFNRAQSTVPSSSPTFSPHFASTNTTLLPYLHQPVYPSGHVYLDVAFLFLHEVSDYTITLCRKLIENTMKYPHCVTLISSPPQNFRSTINKNYIPINETPKLYKKPEHLLCNYPERNYSQRSLLNHLHFNSYTFHTNMRSAYSPFFTLPLDAPNATPSQSPLMASLMPPAFSLHSSSDRLNDTTADPIHSTPAFATSDPRASHLPPFLHLLWVGTPNLLAQDNTLTPYPFPSGCAISQNPTTALHDANNPHLGSPHPNLILTHNRPGYKLFINSHFPTLFKLFLDYWITLMYQRYHWEHGDDNFSQRIGPNASSTPTALIDTFTVQQQLLQCLYTPYILPITQNATDKTQQLPIIFQHLPILFLFLSRFNPHSISPHIIDIFNTLILHLSVPPSSTDLALAAAGNFSSSSSTHIQHLNPSSLQPIDITPKTAVEQSYSNRNNSSQFQNNDTNDHGSQNRSILTSLKSSLFRSKDVKKEQPVTETQNTKDEQESSNIVLTPLNIISTSNTQHSHTMPLTSVHHQISLDSDNRGKTQNNSHPSAFSVASAAQKKSAASYITMLESVLFTEQRHHYQLFYTQQSSKYHSNHLLPTHPTSKESLLFSFISFNTYRLVNMFSFDYFTLLHMILLPYTHPHKHSILTQSLYKMDLPHTQMSSTLQQYLGSFTATPSSLYIPSNINWLMNTIHNTNFSPPAIKSKNAASQSSPLQSQPKVEKLIQYHDSRNTLASLQRQNRIVFLPLSTLTPTNQHHTASFTFTPQLYTLLCMFNSYGFDWNTNILTALPNHFTSTNITQFLDSNLGASEVNGKNSGMGAVTMNMMNTFASQKQLLLSTYTNILSLYIPPIFILQSYFQINSLFVSFMASLCGLQRYISHSALYTNGFGVMKCAYFSLKTPLTAWQSFEQNIVGNQHHRTDSHSSQNVNEPNTDSVRSISSIKSAGSSHGNGSNQLTTPYYKTQSHMDGNALKKPSKHRPILLTSYDLQHYSIEPYQFGTSGGGNGLGNDHRNGNLLPVIQTMFTHGNYGTSKDLDGYSEQINSSNANNTQQFSVDFSSSPNLPTLYATSYPVLTTLSINQYISSTALSGVLLNSNDVGNGNEKSKTNEFYTLLTLHLLRTDLTWDNNWLNLLALYIQNGSFINFKHLYVNSTMSHVSTSASVSTKTASIFTNDILLHYLTGHQFKHSRHISWYKGLLLLLSSGCNVLYFKRNATTTSTNELTLPFYAHTCKKSQLPKHPQVIQNIESIYFPVPEKSSKLETQFEKPSPTAFPSQSSTSPSNAGSECTGSHLQHHGMHYIPSFHRIFQLVQFYHFQGILQWNNKYVNINSALLFHPRVEMRKYWFEIFKVYFTCIYSPWAQLQQYKIATQKQSNKKEQISSTKQALFAAFSFTKIDGANQSTQPRITIDDQFVPQQIQKQMLVHPLLFTHDIVFAFTGRSIHSIAEQIKILSYFATLPFSTFFTLWQQIHAILVSYHREKSLIPLNQNMALHETLSSIGSTLERSFVALNSLPNLIPIQQYTALFEQDDEADITTATTGKSLFPITHADATSGTQNQKQINSNATVKLHVNDIPTHPSTQYSSTLGFATTNTSSTNSSGGTDTNNGGLHKSPSIISSLFEAPTEDELNSGVQRVYVPDGTIGLFWYIMNNCYPHSQYLSTSYVLQNDLNQSTSISSHELRSDPDDVNAVETSTLKQPADLEHLPHDFVCFLDTIISIYNQTNQDALTTTYFTNSNQLNQNLLSHALLRRWPEQVLFALIHYIGIDNLAHHHDFNNFSLHDYLLYLQIDTYAPNFVSFVLQYYATTFKDKQQSIEDKFSTNPLNPASLTNPSQNSQSHNVSSHITTTTLPVQYQQQLIDIPFVPIVEISEDDDAPPPPPPQRTSSSSSSGALANATAPFTIVAQYESCDDEAPTSLAVKTNQSRGTIQIEQSLPPRPSVYFPVPEPLIIEKSSFVLNTSPNNNSGFQRPILQNQSSLGPRHPVSTNLSVSTSNLNQPESDDEAPPPPPS